MSPKKSPEELRAIREAQKRLTWIDNVKRIYNWSDEQAEAEWQRIFVKSSGEGKPTEI